MQIDHHLSELWKKQKWVLFMKHRVYMAPGTTAVSGYLVYTGFAQSRPLKQSVHLR